MAENSGFFTFDKPYKLGYIIDMTRTFIETTIFTKQWKELGFNDEDLRILQNQILENPKIGNVIPGTGRLRKMRFAFDNRGKSGSSRVCYVDFAIFETVYLMTAYQKNEKANLSKKECNDIKRIIEQIEKELGGEKDE